MWGELGILLGEGSCMLPQPISICVYPFLSAFIRFKKIFLSPAH
jgi:hypothetical protein